MPAEGRVGIDLLDLLGLGMSVLDSIQIVESFPATGGVTKVLTSAMMGGGPVPTALCAAARFGVTSGIIDRIGDDWRGDRIEEDYRRFGVSTSHLIRESGCRSSFGSVLVRQSDGERHLLFEEGDFTPLAVEDLPRTALAECRILHLNGRHWPACLEAAAIVRKNGGLVSFDGGANRYQARFQELLPLVDILIVARDFAEQYSGSPDRERQLEALSESGAALVGITDGAAGSWFSEKNGSRFHQPAFSLPAVVDTTGCGDVFHGAFLAAFLAGESVTECARIASAAAAINATAIGGRGHLPTKEETLEWIARQ
jgi:sulfofructose kinase